MEYPELRHLRFALKTTIHEANILQDKLESIKISLGVLERQLGKYDK